VPFYSDSTLTGVDPLAKAFGLVNWNANWGTFPNNGAPTSQLIYATPIWLPFGVPISKVATLIEVAAVGTAITGGYMGVCSPTTMIAQTANIGTAAASYPTGPLVKALSGSVTSYTPTPADSSTGLYYVLLLLNGTFGTTQPTFALSSQTATYSSPSGGTFPGAATAGSAQTVLPANGAAVTLTASNRTYAVGCAP